jgi:hypothetical protein
LLRSRGRRRRRATNRAARLRASRLRNGFQCAAAVH